MSARRDAARGDCHERRLPTARRSLSMLLSFSLSFSLFLSFTPARRWQRIWPIRRLKRVTVYIRREAGDIALVAPCPSREHRVFKSPIIIANHSLRGRKRNGSHAEGEREREMDSCEIDSDVEFARDGEQVVGIQGRAVTKERPSSRPRLSCGTSDVRDQDSSPFRSTRIVFSIGRDVTRCRGERTDTNERGVVPVRRIRRIRTDPSRRPLHRGLRGRKRKGSRVGPRQRYRAAAGSSGRVGRSVGRSVASHRVGFSGSLPAGEFTHRR